MTKEEFNEKVLEMLPECRSYLKQECERLFKCGGVDTDSYDDNYILPKITLAVALINLSDQYTPLLKSHWKTMKNLRHF